VIDEAQNLDNQVLETVRLLSDFETSRTKLLQIILAGQPALEERLRDPSLDQLRQRISIVCRLSPLPVQEVDSYISFRLKTAGYTGTGLFTPDARTRIAELSEGIPRVISNICFNALSLAFATRQKEVTPELIEEVGNDLGLTAKPLVRQVAVVGPVSGSLRQSSLGQQTRSDAVVETVARDRSAAAVHIPALHPQSAAMRPLGLAAAPARAPVRRPQGRGQKAPRRRMQLVERVAAGLATVAVCLSLTMLAFTHRVQRPARTLPPEIASPKEQRPAAFPLQPVSASTTQTGTQPESATAANAGPVSQKSSGSSHTGRTPAKTLHQPGSAVRTTQTDAKPPEVLQVSGSPAMNLRAYLPEPVPRTAVPSFPASSVGPANLPGFVTKMVKPDYPEAARSAAVQGVVTMQALVGTDGIVKQVQVVEGAPELRDAAMQAVRRWQYRPYRENGIARVFQTVVRIRFILDESSEGP
jgi:TonB family protein